MKTTDPQTPVVELQSVRKVYHQRQAPAVFREALAGFFRPRFRELVALDSVSLSVNRGEVVAYAGPNGAGKSTTIKLLSGLLSPNAGRVRVLGFDPVRDRTKFVGRISVVFGQRTELWWDHPIRASFDWKRVVWGIPTDRYHRMFGVVSELLGLDEFHDTLARELSLGQRMRADLGLALLSEPELLLLDEPTLGLDVLAKRRVLSFIKELNSGSALDHRLTVLVTSHDMADLEALAGRIVLIERGKIAYDGDFRTLRQNHVDRRRLIIQTSDATSIAPRLSDATLILSEDERHEYTYDARQVTVAQLLAEAASQVEIVDVETHRAEIDDVIADIFEGWLAVGPPSEEESQTN